MPQYVANNANEKHDSQIHRSSAKAQGLQEKFCKEDQDCLGAPSGRLRLLSKIENLRSNKTTGNFHKCFISCTAEWPDNIILYTKQWQT